MWSVRERARGATGTDKGSLTTDSRRDGPGAACALEMSKVVQPFLECLAGAAASSLHHPRAQGRLEARCSLLFPSLEFIFCFRFLAKHLRIYVYAIKHYSCIYFMYNG